MARSVLRDLVQKLVANADFREKLRHNSEGTLGGHDLTAEEKKALLSVSQRYGFETPSQRLWGVDAQYWWASR